MRLGQFRESAVLSAPLPFDGVILVLDGLRGLVLICTLVLGLMLLGQFAETSDRALCLCQTADGLGQIGDMAARLGPWLAGEQQALRGADHAVRVGAQFEAFAPRILAANTVFYTGNMAQRQLAIEGIAAHLGLDGLMGVVEEHMAGSSAGRVARPGRELAAAHA